MVLKIGVLASTKASDLQALIDAIERKEIDAEISLLISNKENAYCLERAKKHGIETIHINPKKYGSMEEFDREVVRKLDEKGVELILLIGYNKFISPYFVNHFKNRIMNIHPSLLPAFTGWDKNVHKEVIDSGVKVTGATLHFVDEGQDSGPIIMQKAVYVDENETPESLKERIQEVEQEIIVKAVKLFNEGRIKVEGNKVRIINSC